MRSMGRRAVLGLAFIALSVLGSCAPNRGLYFYLDASGCNHFADSVEGLLINSTTSDTGTFTLAVGAYVASRSGEMSVPVFDDELRAGRNDDCSLSMRAYGMGGLLCEGAIIFPCSALLSGNLAGELSLESLFQCGDGSCDSSESSDNCPQDCPICGDGVCVYNEVSCPADCGGGA